MPDKLKEKYYNSYYEYKIMEYRNNHPEVETMDDMSIWVKIGVHFRGEDEKEWLADFLSFCINYELEQRLNDIQNDEPITPIEIEALKRDIKEEILQIVLDDKKELEEDNATDGELREEAKKNHDSLLFGDLNSAISYKNHLIREREIAESILEDDISRGL